MVELKAFLGIVHSPLFKLAIWKFMYIAQDLRAVAAMLSRIWKIREQLSWGLLS